MKESILLFPKLKLIKNKSIHANIILIKRLPYTSVKIMKMGSMLDCLMMTLIRKLFREEVSIERTNRILQK